ncbi:MAG: 4-hydroxy-tetrahydrodipicolinate synthase [Longimicrobiales bacterium]
MADPRFTGSGVALVTPFDARGVNEATMRALVAFHHAEGTDALVVCGSTGEAATMSAQEQRSATDIVIDANAGHLPVIVGCGGSDTAAVAHLARQARDAGADAVLLSAPPYNKPPQRGLVAHFRHVIEEADLPAVIYNVPGRSAVNILPETLAELAQDERVIAVKEASGDLSQVAEVARLVGHRLAIYSGNDDQIVPVLALGGTGVISVLGNVAPHATSRIVKAFLDGNLDEARVLQLRHLPLINALFDEPNPIPVKTAVAWLGFDVGPLRLPLVESDPAKRSALLAALEDLGITPVATA